MIIQRRADQLQPGDILPARNDGFAPRRVITAIAPNNVPCTAQLFVSELIIFEPGRALRPPLAPEYIKLDEAIRVEVPDLTPAQARAEEMLDLLEKVAQHAPAFLAGEARDLLDELRPKPPTMDEVLRVLASLSESTDDPGYIGLLRDDAKTILYRARKTGLLK